jgi:hypothetical protein
MVAFRPITLIGELVPPMRSKRKKGIIERQRGMRFVYYVCTCLARLIILTKNDWHNPKLETFVSKSFHTANLWYLQRFTSRFASGKDSLVGSASPLRVCLLA